MTTRDFTSNEESSLARDFLFAFVVGYLVIMLLRVIVTYTQRKYPLDGPVSHAKAPAPDPGPSAQAT